MNLNKAISRGVISGILLSMAFTVNAFAAIEGSVNDDVVNVRANSSTSSDVITTVDAGQKVLIKYSRDGFYNVSFGANNDVFISQDYVDVVGTNVTVNDNGVNIRNTASKDGAIIGQANIGDKFTVKSIDGEWCSIDFNGSNAYIHTDYLNTATVASAVPLSQEAPVALEIPVVEEPAVTPVVEPELDVLTVPLAVDPILATPAVPLTEAVSVESNTIIAPEVVATETTVAPEVVAPETTVVPEVIAPETTATPEITSTLVAPTEETYVVIETSSGLNMRVAPSTDAEVIATLPNGTALNVQAIDQYWAQVTYNDTVGYVSTEFISLHTGPIPVAAAPDTTKAQVIISYAEQFLGTPYVYGGTDLNNGVDCSGFVYSVFKDNGIQLNRSSRDMYHNGVYVEKSDLQPGDLIFFAEDGVTISHVAIYIGDGKYIHSTDGKGNGVSYANLYDPYSERTYYGARRVL